MTNEVFFKLTVEGDGKEDMAISFSVAVDADVLKKAPAEQLWESVARLLSRHAVLAIESVRRQAEPGIEALLARRG